MRRSRRNVGGYRGRRTSQDILLLIAVALAIVVVVVLGALLMGQRYIVYTDDGLRLDLPFFSSSSSSVQLPDPGDVSLVEKPAASQGQETPQPEKEEPEVKFMAALELPVEAVVQGTAQAQLQEAGANALVLEMKNAQGLLGWKSAHSLADQSEVNGTQTATDAIRTWNQGDVYTVARVCCFRDNAVPYHRNALALRATYGNWRDELGLRWLDPANKDAQAYLAALCGELAELGFDEIVLEQGSFPILGNRETLTTDNAAKAKELVGDFLDRVRKAVEPYETVLSLRVEAAVFTGEAPWCGLDPAEIEEYAHWVWMAGAEAETDPVDLLAGAGVAEAESRLVRILSLPEEEQCGHTALLPKN